MRSIIIVALFIGVTLFCSGSTFAAEAPSITAQPKNEITTHVYGQFGYYRDDGVFVGAQNMQVHFIKVIHSIMDFDPVEVGLATTDSDGVFSSMVTWDSVDVPGVDSTRVSRDSVSSVNLRRQTRSIAAERFTR